MDQGSVCDDSRAQQLPATRADVDGLRRGPGRPCVVHTYVRISRLRIAEHGPGTYRARTWASTPDSDHHGSEPQKHVS